MLPTLEAAELPADAIEVGRIADAWGIKGWFKVLPHSAQPEALFFFQTLVHSAPGFDGNERFPPEGVGGQRAFRLHRGDVP